MNVILQEASISIETTVVNFCHLHVRVDPGDLGGTNTGRKRAEPTLGLPFVSIFAPDSLARVAGMNPEADSGSLGDHDFAD